MDSDPQPQDNSDSLEPSKPSPGRETEPRRTGRWRRPALICLAVCLLTAGFAFWLVTRSWFIVGRVEPALGELMGGQVTIGSASYAGGGRFLFRDVALDSELLTGPEAGIARIGTASVEVQLGNLILGRLRLEDVELRDVDLCISEDAENYGQFNFMTLDPQWPHDPDSTIQLPPRITMRNVLMEFGMHGSKGFELLGQRRMSGQMSPSPEGGAWFEVELGEIDDPNAGLAEGGLLLTARWNAATNEFESHLKGLNLDDQTRCMCPEIGRMWWDRMALEGRVSDLAAQYLADQPLSVVFEVEDVALTMPVDTSEVWTRYRGGIIEQGSGRPRMRVNRGTIRLGITQTGESWLKMEDLHGVLASADADADLTDVPYRVTLHVPTIPPVPKDISQEWMEEVLSTAAFNAVIRMDDFYHQVGEDEIGAAVELPRVVAQIMERFALTDWLLSTQVKLERDAPTAGEDGRWIARPIMTEGKATISHAAGRYFKFPYELREVEAWVEFSNDGVVINPLLGVGSDGAKVWMAGRLGSLSLHPSVSLDVKATGMPLDEELHDALRPNVRAVLDALLTQPFHARLSEAGLLPDENSISAAEQEKRQVQAELAQLQSADDQADPSRKSRIEALTERLRKLQRRIDAGPFQLGGKVDLDLHLERAEGKGQPTYTTGTITLERIGAIYGRFPYPFWITDGAIALDRDRIRVLADGPDDGVSIVTAMGGTGLITGEVEIVRQDGRSQFRPDLSVAVGGEEINDLLLAAIPLSPEEKAAQADTTSGESPTWPGGYVSEAGRLVRDTGLTGRIHSYGTITTKADGRTTFDIAVGLEDGRVEPREALASSLNAASPPWPEGFAVEQIQSLLHIRPHEVELAALAGVHGQGGKLMATGRAGFSDESTETTLDVSIENLPLGAHILNLLPADQADRGRDLWDRFEPEGSFDVIWHHHSVGDEAEPPGLEVSPHLLTLSLDDDRTMQVDCLGGHVAFHGSQMLLNDLELGLQCEDRDEGVVRVEGKYCMAAGDDESEADSSTRIIGSWSGGRFESPVIMEVMSLLKASEQARAYAKHRPRGQLDAEFEYISSAPGLPSTYEVLAHPQSLTMTVNEVDLRADLDLSSMLRFSPDLVEFVDVAGQIEGEPFALGGVIRPDLGPDVDLRFDFTGDLDGLTARTLMPGSVRDVLEAVEFKDGGPTRLVDCQLHLAGQDAGGSAVADNGQAGTEIDTSHVASADGVESSLLDRWEVDFRGRMLNRDATFRAGVTFSEMDSSLDLEVHHRPNTAPQVNMQLLIDRISALECTFEDASTRILLTEEGTRVVIPDFRASSHGGTVTAEADAGVGEDHLYHARVCLAGVGLDGLLSEVAGDNASEEILVANAGDQPSQMWASLTMSGYRGEPESMTGQGAFRVMGGQVARIPMVMRVVQVLHLSAPLGQGLDYAEAEFYMDGQRLVFERMLFESTLFDAIAALQLNGTGDLDLTTLQLNTRFTSRGGLLVVRDVMGGIGDQLMVVEVSGPVGDPKARIVALPGLKR